MEALDCRKILFVLVTALFSLSRQETLLLPILRTAPILTHPSIFIPEDWKAFLSLHSIQGPNQQTFKIYISNFKKDPESGLLIKDKFLVLDLWSYDSGQTLERKEVQRKIDKKISQERVCNFPFYFLIPNLEPVFLALWSIWTYIFSTLIYFKNWNVLSPANTVGGWRTDAAKEESGVWKSTIPVWAQLFSLPFLFWKSTIPVWANFFHFHFFCFVFSSRKLQLVSEQNLFSFPFLILSFGFLAILNTVFIYVLRCFCR